MLKLKVGTLIYDRYDEEWGIILEVEREQEYNTWYKTVWSESFDQSLDSNDFDTDRFELYEV
jgi:hypothetical protein